MYLERIEVLVAINLVLCGTVKISVCLLAGSRGIAKVFSLDDYRLIVMPLMLVMILFSAVVYQNSAQMADFVRVYKYFAFPFQVALPVIVWIIAEIQKKRKSRKPASIKAQTGKA